jgi:hypothetical protein
MSLTFTLLDPQNPERGEQREDHRRKRQRLIEIYRNGCQNAVKNEARPRISAAICLRSAF